MKIFLAFLLWFLPLYLLASKEEKESHAIVFMYHRFGETKYPSTNIRLEQFRFQLEYLKKNNYNVLPLSKIVALLQKNEPLPEKCVALTIDDAYKSIYKEGFPLLKEYGFPFTVFVNTNPIDHHSKRYMNWDEMREMAKFGAEYANHSLTHEYLLQGKDEPLSEWHERFKKEITGAQKRLQEEFGENTNENPKLFSYPFGEYDVQSEKILEELGYVGFTQLSGVVDKKSDFKALPRYAMAEAFAGEKGFVLKLNTLALPVESVTPQIHKIKQGKMPKIFIRLARPIERVNCYLSSGEPILVEQASSVDYAVKSLTPLRGIRERYTCTAPAENGRWYWFSYLWVIENDRRD